MTDYRNNDRAGDSSDVKSLLETIDQLYQVSRSVLNDHTQTSLRMSIAIEAQMLLSKLRVMNRRWKIHLPFKEACQVEFFIWSERMAEICREMSGTADIEVPRKMVRYCPSKHFLLDLYCVIDEQEADSKSKRYYEDTDVKHFVEQQELMRTLVADDWQGYVTKVSDKSVEDLASRSEADIELSYDGQFVQTICCKVLGDLSDELYSLNQRLTMPISRREFARLAERIMIEKEYGGQFAFLKAKARVNTWVNSTPYDRIESERDEQIKECVAEIEKTRFGGLFMQNVKIYKDFDGQYDSFGKFLFAVRDRITKEELSQLFELVFRIHHLRNAPTQNEQADDDDKTSEAAVVRPGNPDLPVEFSQNFRGNDEAVAKFYELLRKAGPHINRPKKSGDTSPGAVYASWKWRHLKDALVKLKLLVGDVGKRTFSEYIHSVFPDRSQDSVYHALFQPDTTTSRGVTADIVKYFRPVSDIVERDLQK